MRQRKNGSFRSIAILTLLIFITTNATWAQPVAPATLEQPALAAILPHELKIPEALGSIQASFEDTEPDKPLVVIIQDAHAVIDAQNHIQGLIQYLEEKYAIHLIALEGGKGQLDPTIFRAFPDEFVKKKVMTEYLNRGELTGGEISAILNSPIGEYFGMEDWNLYESNYLAYLKAVQGKAEVLKEIEESKSKLDQQRRQIYSAPLNEFHEQLDIFQNQNTYLLEFLKYLGSIPGAKDKMMNYPYLSKLYTSFEFEKDTEKEKGNIESAIRQMADAFKVKYLKKMDVKQEMDFHKNYQAFVTNQLDSAGFLKYLVQTGESFGLKAKLTPTMMRVLGHSQTLAAIKGTKVFEELQDLIRETENEFAKTPEEKALVEKYRELKLLKDLASLELTRDQWKEIEALKGRNGEMEKRRDIADSPILPFADSIFQPALEFYRLAVQRDQAFRKNIKVLMEKQKGKAVIVLAGGFHAQGFESNLKEDGIPYVLISPKIESLAGQETYQDVMQGKLSYKPYLRTTFYDAFVRHSSLQLVSQLNEPDFRKNLKVWRDEILRRLSREGRITQAANYTRYIDLLLKIYYEKYGKTNQKPKSKEEILKIVEAELNDFQESTVNRLWGRFQSQFKEFTGGLKALAQRKALTVQNASSLLEHVSRGGTGTSLLSKQVLTLDPNVSAQETAFMLNPRELLAVSATPIETPAPIGDMRVALYQEAGGVNPDLNLMANAKVQALARTYAKSGQQASALQARALQTKEFDYQAPSVEKTASNVADDIGSLASELGVPRQQVAAAVLMNTLGDNQAKPEMVNARSEARQMEAQLPGAVAVKEETVTQPAASGFFEIADFKLNMSTEDVNKIQAEGRRVDHSNILGQAFQKMNIAAAFKNAGITAGNSIRVHIKVENGEVKYKFSTDLGEGRGRRNFELIVSQDGRARFRPYNNPKTGVDLDQLDTLLQKAGLRRLFRENTNLGEIPRNAKIVVRTVSKSAESIIFDLAATDKEGNQGTLRVSVNRTGEIALLPEDADNFRRAENENQQADYNKTSYQLGVYVPKSQALEQKTQVREPLQKPAAEAPDADISEVPEESPSEDSSVKPSEVAPATVARSQVAEDVSQRADLAQDLMDEDKNSAGGRSEARLPGNLQRLTPAEAARYANRLQRGNDIALGAQKQLAGLSADQRLEVIATAALGRAPSRAEMREIKEQGIFSQASLGVRKLSEFPQGMSQRLKRQYLPDTLVGYVEISDRDLNYLRQKKAFSAQGVGLHNPPDILPRSLFGNAPLYFNLMDSIVYRKGANGEINEREAFHETAHIDAAGYQGRGTNLFVDRPQLQVILLEELDAYRRMNLNKDGTIDQSYAAGQRGLVLTYVEDTLNQIKGQMGDLSSQDLQRLRSALRGIVNQAMDAISRLDQVLPALDVTHILRRTRTLQEIIALGNLPAQDLIDLFRPGFTQDELEKVRTQGFNPGNWVGTERTRRYQFGDGKALALGLLNRQARERDYLARFFLENPDRKDMTNDDAIEAAVSWARPRINYLLREGGPRELSLIKQWLRPEDPVLAAAVRSILQDINQSKETPVPTQKKIRPFTVPRTVGAKAVAAVRAEVRSQESPYATLYKDIETPFFRSLESQSYAVQAKLPVNRIFLKAVGDDKPLVTLGRIITSWDNKPYYGIVINTSKIDITRGLDDQSPEIRTKLFEDILRAAFRMDLLQETEMYQSGSSLEGAADTFAHLPPKVYAQAKAVFNPATFENPHPTLRIAENLLVLRFKAYQKYRSQGIPAGEAGRLVANENFALADQAKLEANKGPSTIGIDSAEHKGGYNEEKEGIIAYGVTEEMEHRVIPPFLELNDIPEKVTEEVIRRNGYFIQTPEQQIAIFDHHHKAVLAWRRAFAEGKIGKNASLYHIDDHEDDNYDRQTADLEGALQQDALTLEAAKSDPEARQRYLESVRHSVGRHYEIATFIAPEVLEGFIDPQRWFFSSLYGQFQNPRRQMIQWRVQQGDDKYNSSVLHFSKMRSSGVEKAFGKGPIDILDLDIDTWGRDPGSGENWRLNNALDITMKLLNNPERIDPKVLEAALITNGKIAELDIDLNNPIHSEAFRDYLRLFAENHNEKTGHKLDEKALPLILNIEETIKQSLPYLLPLMTRAKVITMATSPGYMKAESSTMIVNVLLRELKKYKETGRLPEKPAEEPQVSSDYKDEEAAKIYGSLDKELLDTLGAIDIGTAARIAEAIYPLSLFKADMKKSASDGDSEELADFAARVNRRSLAIARLGETAKRYQSSTGADKTRSDIALATLMALYGKTGTLSVEEKSLIETFMTQLIPKADRDNNENIDVSRMNQSIAAAVPQVKKALARAEVRTEKGQDLDPTVKAAKDELIDQLIQASAKLSYGNAHDKMVTRTSYVGGVSVEESIFKKLFQNLSQKYGEEVLVEVKKNLSVLTLGPGRFFGVEDELLNLGIGTVRSIGIPGSDSLKRMLSDFRVYLGKDLEKAKRFEYYEKFYSEALKETKDFPDQSVDIVITLGSLEPDALPAETSNADEIGETYKELAGRVLKPGAVILNFGIGGGTGYTPMSEDRRKQITQMGFQDKGSAGNDYTVIFQQPAVLTPNRSEVRTGSSESDVNLGALPAGQPAGQQGGPETQATQGSPTLVSSNAGQIVQSITDNFLNMLNAPDTRAVTVEGESREAVTNQWQHVSLKSAAKDPALAKRIFELYEQSYGALGMQHTDIDQLIQAAGYDHLFLVAEAGVANPSQQPEKVLGMMLAKTESTPSTALKPAGEVLGIKIGLIGLDRSSEEKAATSGRIFGKGFRPFLEDMHTEKFPEGVYVEVSGDPEKGVLRRVLSLEGETKTPIINPDMAHLILGKAKEAVWPIGDRLHYGRHIKGLEDPLPKILIGIPREEGMRELKINSDSLHLKAKDLPPKSEIERALMRQGYTPQTLAKAFLNFDSVFRFVFNSVAALVAGYSFTAIAFSLVGIATSPLLGAAVTFFILMLFTLSPSLETRQVLGVQKMVRDETVMKILARAYGLQERALRLRVERVRKFLSPVAKPGEPIPPDKNIMDRIRKKIANQLKVDESEIEIASVTLNGSVLARDEGVLPGDMDLTIVLTGKKHTNVHFETDLILEDKNAFKAKDQVLKQEFTVETISLNVVGKDILKGKRPAIRSVNDFFATIFHFRQMAITSILTGINVYGSEYPQESLIHLYFVLARMTAIMWMDASLRFMLPLVAGFASVMTNLFFGLPVYLGQGGMTEFLLQLGLFTSIAVLVDFMVAGIRSILSGQNTRSLAAKNLIKTGKRFKSARVVSKFFGSEILYDARQGLRRLRDWLSRRSSEAPPQVIPKVPTTTDPVKGIKGGLTAPQQTQETTPQEPPSDQSSEPQGDPTKKVGRAEVRTTEEDKELAQKLLRFRGGPLQSPGSASVAFQGDYGKWQLLFIMTQIEKMILEKILQNKPKTITMYNLGLGRKVEALDELVKAVTEVFVKLDEAGKIKMSEWEFNVIGVDKDTEDVLPMAELKKGILEQKMAEAPKRFGNFQMAVERGDLLDPDSMTSLKRKYGEGDIVEHMNGFRPNLEAESGQWDPRLEELLTPNEKDQRARIFEATKNAMIVTKPGSLFLVEPLQEFAEARGTALLVGNKVQSYVGEENVGAAFIAPGLDYALPHNQGFPSPSGTFYSRNARGSGLYNVTDPKAFPSSSNQVRVSTSLTDAQVARLLALARETAGLTSDEIEKKYRLNESPKVAQKQTETAARIKPEDITRAIKAALAKAPGQRESVEQLRRLLNQANSDVARYREQKKNKLFEDLALEELDEYLIQVISTNAVIPRLFEQFSPKTIQNIKVAISEQPSSVQPAQEGQVEAEPTTPSTVRQIEAALNPPAEEAAPQNQESPQELQKRAEVRSGETKYFYWTNDFNPSRVDPVTKREVENLIQGIETIDRAVAERMRNQLNQPNATLLSVLELFTRGRVLTVGNPLTLEIARLEKGAAFVEAAKKQRDESLPPVSVGLIVFKERFGIVNEEEMTQAMTQEMRNLIAGFNPALGVIFIGNLRLTGQRIPIGTLARLIQEKYFPSTENNRAIVNAMIESITNAVIHGNREAAGNLVALRFRFANNQLILDIIDEGKKPINLEPSGRKLAGTSYYNGAGQGVQRYVTPYLSQGFIQNGSYDFPLVSSLPGAEQKRMGQILRLIIRATPKTVEAIQEALTPSGLIISGAKAKTPKSVLFIGEALNEQTQIEKEKDADAPKENAPSKLIIPSEGRSEVRKMTPVTLGQFFRGAQAYPMTEAAITQLEAQLPKEVRRNLNIVQEEMNKSEQEILQWLGNQMELTVSIQTPAFRREVERAHRGVPVSSMDLEALTVRIQMRVLSPEGLAFGAPITVQITLDQQMIERWNTALMNIRNSLEAQDRKVPLELVLTEETTRKDLDEIRAVLREFAPLISDLSIMYSAQDSMRQADWLNFPLSPRLVRYKEGAVTKALDDDQKMLNRLSGEYSAIVSILEKEGQAFNFGQKVPPYLSYMVNGQFAKLPQELRAQAIGTMVLFAILLRQGLEDKITQLGFNNVFQKGNNGFSLLVDVLEKFAAELVVKTAA